MGDTAARSGNIGCVGILVERDQVVTSRSIQKHHLIAASKLFPHPKSVAIKPKRPLHIPNDQMNVGETFGADHKTSAGVLKDILPRNPLLLDSKRGFAMKNRLLGM